MLNITEGNKALLRTSLLDVIEKWSGRIAESDMWPGHYHGEATDLMMADAALAVLWAVAEAQDYALEQSYYKEA